MTGMQGTKAGAVLAALLLAGCASAPPSNAYCKLAKPISYSRAHDTKNTVRQIVAHNAVWKSQSCPK
jgi:uncharacterized lipoprotein YmbA